MDVAATTVGAAAASASATTVEARCETAVGARVGEGEMSKPSDAPVSTALLRIDTEGASPDEDAVALLEMVAMSAAELDQPAMCDDACATLFCNSGNEHCRIND